jgi:hypothetical protein
MASETAGARHEELTRLVMAAVPAPFWLDRPDAPPAREALRGEESCDLAVAGGGFGGLWAALLAKEANPGRSAVLIEGNRVGWAASGRNGGFCEASLTHGAANGRKRFGGEFGTLQRLGMENEDAIEAAIGRYGIDCDFERVGPSPSRLSRSPTWACRPPAGPWPGPTGRPAAGTCGCGRWTRRASASTPEGSRRLSSERAPVTASLARRLRRAGWVR